MRKVYVTPVEALKKNRIDWENQYKKLEEIAKNAKGKDTPFMTALFL